MKKEDVLNIVEKCFHGDPPSCAHACPFHLDIRSFCEKASAGRWNTVYKYMRDSLVFPVVVKNICPMTCASKCQRPLIGDEAIDMTLLEDAAIKLSKNKAPIKFAIPPKKETVAVIGAGVSGLAVTLNLAQKKYNVTVFDAKNNHLGSLSSHEKADEFREDIDLQFSAVSCEFEYNKEIKSLDELSTFDAIFVASGDSSLNKTALSDEIETLIPSYNKDLFSTSRDGVFMGGELCGYSKVQAIADSVKIANIIESYLMTGKPLREKEEKFLPERLHMLPHDNDTSASKIIPSNGESYNKEEAELEASRCFLCDCRACLDNCEMLASFSKRPQKLAQEAFADTHVAPPFSSCTLTKQVFSCSECDYCKSVCPVDINLGELFQIGKAGRIEAKTEPKAYHEFWLRDFEFASKQASYMIPPNISEKSSTKNNYLFFPGCKLGETNPEYVTKSFDILQEKYGAGIYLNCCGVPALWAGERNIFDEHIVTLSKTWEELEKPTMVLACTYCEKVINKYLPNIETCSLYSLLAESPELLGKISAHASTFQDMIPAIFDPCAASENQSCKEAVRSLCKTSEVDYIELIEDGKCCGFGGHTRVANDELYDKITDTRISADDAPYIVYCANCLSTFKSKNKDCKHILDIVLDINDVASAMTLQDKRLNAISLKNTFIKKQGKEEFILPENKWDSLSLIINDETQSYMNEKLILLSDLKETIYNAENAGSLFVNAETDTTLAFFEKPFIIFWVEYKKTDDGEYKIINTYYHRMHPRSDTNDK